MTIAAIRFNNPGDVSLPIKGWTGGGKVANNGKGIRGQIGYAEFPTMKVGFEAAQFRVESYIERGYNTIAKLNRVYAQDQHWHISVSEISKIPVGAVLDPDDTEQMQTLTAAIIRQETGLTEQELGLA